MGVLVMVVVSCELCGPVATPRLPVPGKEVAKLVYRRLVGQHQ